MLATPNVRQNNYGEVWKKKDLNGPEVLHESEKKKSLAVEEVRMSIF